jgi:hypothetical protein
MTTPQEAELLVEQVVSAHRATDPRTLALLPSNAFADLDEESRVRAFEAATMSRVIEAGLDPDGLSTTSRAVLRMIGARPR